MAKPDPALLDPARYPFTCRIEPRFGDLDVNLHINNVAMASMLEESHVRLHRASGYRQALPAGVTTMVASVTIEYLGEGAYPDPVDFHLAVSHVGRTSHEVVKLVMQNGRVIAFSRTVMVTVGPDGPVAIPPSFTKQVDRWMLRA
ncbi:acyl-CoA thioester hydrolase [Novosphingobium chloroacetimidivorans]|uniref:Acyl-CoA thioester hydrolase n=1 Tax=Novosphingobium chloroacetimidivorans TaxID=1428314 RepID=A0A7W7NW87_9SPHN|nr:acyl-CoA thioesterase [Novosphingobium chloroacetimidivorans]MBB4857842.1 acyl-CoA thioester hydrolase [Novosphingobium chloroacetimidivorans]